MWLRRAFFVWLIPSAFLLPLWLLIGWGVFNAQALGLLWVLLIAIPSVFVGQLLFTLLVRARGMVRATRAVSWTDALGFTVWQGLTVALGFFDPASWVALFITAILAGLAMFWYLLWALVREARPRSRADVAEGADPQVIVISETRGRP
ncbi:MAG: MFS transporter permease [Microbacterium sp.]|uniref:MFS transporter permease n=1 Tax=Microbacterium sp. TaxID=51671 RepID=UPI003A8AF640